MTRARFEKENEATFKKLIDPVRDCLSDSGFLKKKLQDVVLVGGSTRIPKIVEMMEDYFKDRKLFRSINPDEAIAYGATIHASVLTGKTPNTEELLLLDVIPLSIGIKTQYDINAIIIPRNTNIPISKKQMFSAADDFVDHVDIEIGEGERPIFSDNHKLGQFQIKIKPCRSSESKLEVSLDMTSEGVLKVTAKDVLSKNMESLQITSDKRTLTKEDIERIISEADDKKDMDNEKKYAAEKKYNLKNYIREARQIIEDKDKVKDMPEDEQKYFKLYLSDLDTWCHYTEASCKDVQEKIDELNEKLQKIRKNEYKGETEKKEEIDEENEAEKNQYDIDELS